MNYELAKELKDAGFPQEPFGPFITPNGSIVAVNFEDPKEEVTGITYSEGATVPTLSELIEACGDVSFTLGIYKNGCFDESIGRCYATALGITTYGSTPEEAVARQWLALNKK